MLPQKIHAALGSNLRRGIALYRLPHAGYASTLPAAFRSTSTFGPSSQEESHVRNCTLLDATEPARRLVSSSPIAGLAPNALIIR
jgi:hypothetical protein